MDTVYLSRAQVDKNKSITANQKPFYLTFKAWKNFLADDCTSEGEIGPKLVK